MVAMKNAVFRDLQEPHSVNIPEDGILQKDKSLMKEVHMATK
jgi:hypothetical protein